MASELSTWMGCSYLVRIERLRKILKE